MAGVKGVRRRTLPSPAAAFSGLVSTHLALSGSVRFPGNRDRRLSVLTLLADSPCVKWNVEHREHWFGGVGVTGSIRSFAVERGVVYVLAASGAARERPVPCWVLTGWRGPAPDA